MIIICNLLRIYLGTNINKYQAEAENIAFSVNKFS